MSTETAGTLETVAHGETGWLVNQDSDVAETMAAQALSVLDFDGPAMSKSSRARAEMLFFDQVTMSRFLEVYDRLLAVRPWRRR